jgi:nucleotide-binding universal stress UspA family protein
MVTINRILCPIDFSDFSQHALARAVAIAKTHRASVTVLHVVQVQPPWAPLPLEVTAPPPLQLSPEDLARVRSHLSAFVRLTTPDDVAITCEVVEAPAIHAEILAQASRLAVDLIVMGTHGRSGFQRLLLGSVAEKVSRSARQPVLTVGAAAGGGSGSFTRILCGIDFSKCSLAALDYALALAEGPDARVTAANVIEWTPVGYDPLVGPPTDLAGYRLGAESAARERLRTTIAGANGNHVHVDEVVTAGKPHHELLRIARDRDCDLIVLGIHGRNPIDRLIFGSTAEPVLRRSVCPVLSIRSESAANVAAA